MIFSNKKKNRAAFEESVLEYLDVLYNTALRMTGQVMEAEDLVQDTYLRAMRFRRRFEPGTNLKAWLFKMMVNLLINRYRRDQKGKEIVKGHQQQAMIDRLYPYERMASTTRPQEYFFEQMFCDDVVAAIEKLPTEFKLVVLLVDINEFSYSQVADILTIPVGTVMSRLHRGRKLLRAMLYDFAIEEGYIKGEDQPVDSPQPTDLSDFRERKQNCGKGEGSWTAEK